MMISDIRKTFTTLALSSLCAAPVFAQDIQGGEPMEQTQAPVEHAEDSPVQFRNEPAEQERPMRDTRAQPSERKTRGEASMAGRDDTKRGEAGAAGDRTQGSQQRAMHNLRTDSVSLSNLDGAQVESLQRVLQQSEFYSGPIDGMPGPQTRRALRRFYRAQADLAASGRLFSGGAAALGLEASEIELVKGKGEPERKTAAGRESGEATTAPGREGRGAQAQPKGQSRSDTAAGTMDDSGEPKLKDGERKMQQKKPSDQSPNDATQMH